MDVLQTFMLTAAWIALATLVFLEIVLGMDNIVFLSIMTSKLPEEQQAKGRIIGLLLAMFTRIGLLFGVSLLMQLTKPLLSFSSSWINGTITGQSIIIFAGGLFLLYKSVTEIHDKIETSDEESNINRSKSNFWSIMAQIALLNLIFSFDSVLTAVGMVSFREFGYEGAMAIMIIAIVLTVIMMMFFSGPISKFVNNHPTIQMLAFAFLILIGLMLIIEAAYLSQLVIFGRKVSEIPKGYIYFAIAFSLLVEFLNNKLRKKSKSKMSI